MITEGIKVDAVRVEKTDGRTAVKPHLRAGIVGAGLMGRWHAHAIERVGGCVVGIADRDLARALSLAARHRGATAFSAAEQMLAEQELDVLHICSPTETHESIAAAALRRGIHVLVEKPIAATARETGALYGLAEEHGALLCPVHQFAFQDGVARARKQLLKIGRLVHIEANIRSAGARGFDESQIDLIAADILPHPLSMISTFLVSGISSVKWDIKRPADGELRVLGQAEDTSVSIFISMNSRPTENSFHLVGTDGTIHIDLFHGFSSFQPGAVSRTRKILRPFDLALRSFAAAGINLARRSVQREPAYPGLRSLIGEFYGSIRSVADAPITPANAIAIARTRDLLIARINQGDRCDRIF
ncbi:MAG: Gfo/Idh/MocA family oxidoreductase [Acidobacteriota bacterium]